MDLSEAAEDGNKPQSAPDVGESPLDVRGVVSELELVVAALCNLVEKFHTVEPFKLPPVWPMVRHAAHPRLDLTAAYFAKVLDRYGDELMELDLSRSAEDNVATIEEMIAQRVLSSLRVLRGVSRAPPASCAPRLEELYGRESALSTAERPEPHQLFPSLRKSTGRIFCNLDFLHAPLIEQVTLPGATPAALAAFFERSPHLVSVDLLRGQERVLVNSFLAPALRHLVFEAGRLFAPTMLTQFSQLVSIELSGDVHVVTLLSAIPSLTKLGLRTGALGPMPLFDSLARLHTLDLQLERSAGQFLPMSSAKSESRLSNCPQFRVCRCACAALQLERSAGQFLQSSSAEAVHPNAIALQNLRCINCALPDSFINVFVHPGLKSLEMTHIRSTVLDALKSSAPRLHTLILSGNCDADGAVTGQILNFDEVLMACGGAH